MAAGSPGARSSLAARRWRAAPPSARSTATSGRCAPPRARRHSRSMTDDHADASVVHEPKNVKLATVHDIRVKFLLLWPSFVEEHASQEPGWKDHAVVQEGVEGVGHGHVAEDAAVQPVTTSHWVAQPAHGPITPKPANEEGWPYRIAIKEILGVDASDPESNNVVKLESK